MIEEVKKMECCSTKMMALCMLIVGIILILVRLYTSWDIWIVLGVIAVIKGLIMLVMPSKQAKKR